MGTEQPAESARGGAEHARGGPGQTRGGAEHARPAPEHAGDATADHAAAAPEHAVVGPVDGADRPVDPDVDGSAGEGSAAPVGPDEGPDSPTGLSGSSIWAALRRTVKEFQRDNLTDWAAALTYYGMLSLFPALLVLVSILGLLPDDTQASLQDTLTGMVPQPQVKDIVTSSMRQLQESRGAGLVAALGLLGAYWSASGYIGAFMRAANAIYDVPEGRPIWKTLPIRVGVTGVVGLMVLASAFIVVFTGRFAERAGGALGLGSTVVTVWDVAKWPVLLMLVGLTFAILYWAAPNARHGGFRWITPGGVFAVVIWMIVSGAFAFYVANFGSYNKTYGTLAGVIIFLVWLWLTNLAVLLGAELDAELERGRAIAAGLRPMDKEPYVQLRDDRKLQDRDRPSDLG
ncbi:YihY/virulence factor BrkB family protein [Plantactinospora sp. KBS50]|uniref:YihY/virulence factor BrkB family protein n=1 Tax=Plantactinospora sp. KBS50 TaxID=2024580 RepID=UPI000BAB010E|nr:YihY/virulence factor BrkB family protein [Plantactinospora sp. KBS50]ASW56220.1 ribonuclease [Plantactinospora sp. KBS50]